MTKWGIHLKDGSPEIIVEGNWFKPTQYNDTRFFEFLGATGTTTAVFAQDSVAAMVEYGPDKPPEAGMTILAEFNREMLTSILGDLQDMLDNSPPGGCHWCGFSSHRGCTGAEKIKYLEAILGTKGDNA